MLLTEAQARKKWCPYVRFSLTERDGNASNRHMDAARMIVQNPMYSQCIASDCMAWREATDGQGHQEGDDPRFFRGYCGLAGVPGARHA